MAKAEFLKERAEGFLKDADFDIKEKRWFAAAFHLEQVCQFYLKYYLFLKLGDFPKTHSLNELLEDIGRAYEKQKEVKSFLRKNQEIISDLEQAYITARYLPVEFSKEKIKKMRNFVGKLKKFLKKIYGKIR